MNKVQKFLQSLNKKEHEAFLLVLLQIEKDFTKIPGVKKLQGTKDIYRVRVGRYRIIFQHNSQEFEIVRISKRDEQTYKNL